MVNDSITTPETCWQPFDMGLWYKNAPSLSDEQKYELIQSVWRSSSTYKFPTHEENIGGGKKKRKTQRCFQLSWLQRWSWLVYSEKYDGGFCLPCVLFAKSRTG